MTEVSEPPASQASDARSEFASGRTPPTSIRILMLVDAIGPDAGGGERMALGLSEALAANDFDVTLCVTRTCTPATRASLERAGVRVLSLERAGRLSFRGFRPLVRLLRRERFDVLHAHKFGSNVWGVLFGRLFRVPVIVAHEQTWAYASRPRMLLDGLIGRLASVFVAVSSADRDRMIALERVPPEKTRMIPNAYIPRRVPPNGDLRAQLGLDADTPIVGTAAVFRPQKAIEVLIDAFARLSGANPEAHLIVAGDGPSRASIADRVAELDLTDRIHFPGMRDDIVGVLAAFDVAAMSSDFEGTPLFAVECMANRTPLVATDVGGMKDLIENGKTGVLVPPRDPEALAQAIEDLLNHPARRAELVEAAYARSKELEIDRVATRFSRLYESLLESRRA